MSTGGIKQIVSHNGSLMIVREDGTLWRYYQAGDGFEVQQIELEFPDTEPTKLVHKSEIPSLSNVMYHKDGGRCINSNCQLEHLPF